MVTNKIDSEEGIRDRKREWVWWECIGNMYTPHWDVTSFWGSVSEGIMVEVYSLQE